MHVYVYVCAEQTKNPLLHQFTVTVSAQCLFFFDFWFGSTLFSFTLTDPGLLSASIIWRLCFVNTQGLLIQGEHFRISLETI